MHTERCSLSLCLPEYSVSKISPKVLMEVVGNYHKSCQILLPFATVQYNRVLLDTEIKSLTQRSPSFFPWLNSHIWKILQAIKSSYYLIYLKTLFIPRFISELLKMQCGTLVGKLFTNILENIDSLQHTERAVHYGSKNLYIRCAIVTSNIFRFAVYHKVQNTINEQELMLLQ